MKLAPLLALALSAFVAPLIAQAAESSFNPASLNTKISSEGRKPASTCVASDSLDGLQAIAIPDYAKCSPTELAAIRGLLMRVIEKVSVQVKDKSLPPLVTATAIAYTGAAKGSLALVDAQLAR